MRYLYNKIDVEETTKSDSEIEILNRNLSEDLKYNLHVGEFFPPTGKIFETGVGLREKIEKEKILSGEISLSVIVDQVVEKINASCNQKILSGFESSALGEVHVYDSEETDQLNLIGAVAGGGTVYFKCERKSDGVKEFYPHTNTQIKKVLSDGTLRKVTLLQNCYLLKQAVRALNDYDAVIGFDVNGVVS